MTWNHVSLQEGYRIGRKRGWCKCDNCGMITAFGDKEIIKSHISGKGCQSDRVFFGLKLRERFNDGKVRILKPKAPHKEGER